MHRRRWTVVASLAMLPLAPAVARGDSIVFRRGGDVWLMAPDGSGQRAVTSGRAYEWPSSADDGTLLAADPTGRLYKFTQAGAAVGEPIPTAASFATEDAPAETPTHVRISPDGTRVAYDEAIGGDLKTLWTPSNVNGLSFPGQSAGQQGLVSPAWVGNGQLMLSRDISDDNPADAMFSLYTVGDGDNAAVPWFNDPDAAWATGFDATASRDGTRIAVLEDDAANQGGTPQRVVLRLFAAAAPGAPPEFRCEIAVEAADTSTSASPTFSPDGSGLAWAESDGIHVAALGGLSDCGAIRERVVTLPGAWEPYWSPADDRVPAASGGSGGARLTLALATRARPHRATVLKRGIGAKVTVSAPATVRFTLRLAGTKRVVGAAARKLHNAGTSTVHIRLRANALRGVTNRFGLVLRASAVGAKPVAKTIRVR